MTRRLTVQIKDDIIDAVIIHRFQEEARGCLKRQLSFVDHMYTHHHRKAERLKMSALPTGWLDKVSYMVVQLGDLSSSPGYTRLNFNGTTDMRGLDLIAETTAPDQVKRLCLAKHSRGVWFTLPDDHKATLQYMEIKAQIMDLKTRVDAATTTIRAALNEATTVASLIKAWPEIQPLVEKVVPPAQPRTQLALPTERLNAVCGLPIEGAQACM